MTNKWNTVIYTGVTNDLKKRVFTHKKGLEHGFTKKYKLNKLVYYECFNNIIDAIMREKQIKAGSRRKKDNLIFTLNPQWNDLYHQI